MPQAPFFSHHLFDASILRCCRMNKINQTLETNAGPGSLIVKNEITITLLSRLFAVISDLHETSCS